MSRVPDQIISLRKAREQECVCTIRPAVHDDLNAVVAIENSSFLEPWPHSIFVKELEFRSWSRFVVAHLGDELVGYLIYWLIKSELHLLNLAVHLKWRRRGVGLSLVEHMIRRGSGEGQGEVKLEVRMSNKPAQLLYQNCGFEPFAIKPGYYTNNGEDALVMQLKLGDPKP